MKVYVLIERIYNYDSLGDEYSSWIDGAFYKKEDCKKKMQEEIKHNIQDFDFVEDTDNKIKEDYKILFYGYQENWNNYIEFEIIEEDLL